MEYQDHLNVMGNLIPTERIEKSILFIRGQKVMLDADLAALYGVETYNLNKSVKRNMERFPKHFMFQLTDQEFNQLKNALSDSIMKTQFGISKSGWGGRRTPPFAFTEQGVAMLSSILKSKQAIQVNIAIIDTFVRLRQMISSHTDLVRKINHLEKKYDHQFKAVFDALRQLMNPTTDNNKRLIGFERDK